jgi:capsular exopolysaccharide synthesis family protein
LCASLNAAQASKPFKLVMVTSALANEGKSTIAANLASFLAMTGKHVLLVDANSHHPVLDQRFQLEDRQGSSSAWSELKVELDGQETKIPTLRVLTAGSLPSNSAELLQSSLTNQLFDHFKKVPFDYVIFDTPALLPVADAQILASYVQATVLVIDASKTPRKVLLRAKRVLNRTHATLIGAVLNKSPWPEDSDVRPYLNGRWQPKAVSDMAMLHTTSVDGSPITIPTTPSTNGAVDDADMTIAISHQDKDSGEK